MPNPQNVEAHKRSKGDPPLPGAGRPKGSLNVRTILNKLLSQKEEIDDPLTGKKRKATQLEIITLKQLQAARKGNLPAFNALLDRYEGKPEQKTINEFPEGTEINLTVPAPRIPGKAPEAPPAADAEV